MPVKDAYSRLLDDESDIEPQNGLPAWESNASGWNVLQTPKGVAVVYTGGGPATGMVRFPDRTIVPIPPGEARDVCNRAESILREGPSGWALLELDVFDPEEKKPAPVAAPPAAEEVREAPVRTGQKGAFPWKFR